MKFQAVFLLAMVVALSGFTWGSAESEKATVKKTSQVAKKETATVKKASQTASTYSSAASAYVPAPSTDNRASAVRVLTAGDDATRKARLESLARIAKSLSAAKQAREKPAYQY